MKQHITSKQLKEINDLQLKRICNILIWSNLQTDIEWMYASEELTISKMIDILSNYKQIEITQGRVWWVTFIDNSLKVSGNELCDALWEGVKYILNIEEDN